MIIIIVASCVDFASALMFSCIVSAFVLPLVIERIIYYIPHLLTFARAGQVKARSVWFSIFEVLGWIIGVTGIYTYFYFYQSDFFGDITGSIPAFIGWFMGAVVILYKFTHMERMVKRTFYYETYNRYVTEEGYAEYAEFVESLDDLDMDQLTELSNQKLPYMHQQSLNQKIAERNAGVPR